MHKASVNNKVFEVDQTPDGTTVDGKLLNWDLTEIANGYFHIIHDSKTYRAELVKADQETKTFRLKINGRIYSVTLKDKFDLLLEKMGMNSASSSRINNVKAPMPGLIIDLKVQPGDQVNAGDPLLVLEAMKMENILKATGAGTVKAVKIKKGDSVEKGQILLEF